MTDRSRSTSSSGIRSTNCETVCKEIIANKFRVFAAAHRLLQELIKNDSLIGLEYFPLETFAKEQSVRMLTAVKKRMNSRRLTQEDVKDHVENIVASFKIYKSRHSLEGGVSALRSLQNFVVAMFELCTVMEAVGNRPPTNWQECLKLCENRLREEKIISYYEARKFIPRIEDFKPTRKLGSGGFGVVYEAIHVPTSVQVCVKLVGLGRLKKLSFVATDKILVSVAGKVFL